MRRSIRRDVRHSIVDSILILEMASQPCRWILEKNAKEASRHKQIGASYGILDLSLVYPACILQPRRAWLALLQIARLSKGGLLRFSNGGYSVEMANSKEECLYSNGRPCLHNEEVKINDPLKRVAAESYTGVNAKISILVATWLSQNPV